MRCHSSWVAEAERLRRDLATARSALANEQAWTRELGADNRLLIAQLDAAMVALERFSANTGEREMATEALDRINELGKARAALTPATGEPTT